MIASGDLFLRLPAAHHSVLAGTLPCTAVPHAPTLGQDLPEGEDVQWAIPKDLAKWHIVGQPFLGAMEALGPELACLASAWASQGHHRQSTFEFAARWDGHAKQQQSA